MKLGHQHDIQRELDEELQTPSSWNDASSSPSAGGGSYKYPVTSTKDPLETGGTTTTLSLRIYLKKYAFIVKLLCIVDFILSIFRCFTPNAFWLGSGIIFAPMGFYGAYKFRRFYVFAYAMYCFLEVILLFSFSYARITDRTQMTLFMVSALGEAIVAYHVWTFFQRIPIK